MRRWRCGGGGVCARVGCAENYVSECVCVCVCVPSDVIPSLRLRNPYSLLT